MSESNKTIGEMSSAERRALFDKYLRRVDGTVAPATTLPDRLVQLAPVARELGYRVGKWWRDVRKAKASS